MVRIQSYIIIVRSHQTKIRPKEGRTDSNLLVKIRSVPRTGIEPVIHP
jgi:hypothetical protein